MKGNLLKATNNITSYFMAVIFSLSGITVFNLILLNTPLAPYRKIISVALFLLLDICLYISFASFLRNRSDAKKIVLIIALINIIYFLPDIVTGSFTSYAQYLILVFPFSVIAIFIAVSDDERERFLKCMDRLAIIVSLIACYFIYLLITTTDDDNGMYYLVHNVLHIYKFTHGNIALFFTPFLFITIGNLAFGRYKGKKEIAYFAYALFILYTIICAGLRNAILSIFIVIIFAILGIVFKFFEPENKKKSLVQLFALLFFASIIFSNPNIFVMRSSRLKQVEGDIIQDLRDKEEKKTADFELGSKFVVYANEEETEEEGKPRLDMEALGDLPAVDAMTGEEATIRTIFIKHIFASDKTEKEVNKMLHDDIKKKTGRYIIVSDENRDDTSKYTVYRDRNYLWKAAINEWRKSKIVGNGIKHYQTKYEGTMPHNVILELLSDYGLIGTIICTILFFALFIKTLIYIRRKKSTLAIIMLLVIAFFPQFLFYTSVYNEAGLLFVVTFMISCLYISRKTKGENE